MKVAKIWRHCYSLLFVCTGGRGSHSVNEKRITFRVCQSAQLLAIIGCRWKTALCKLRSGRSWQSAASSCKQTWHVSLLADKWSCEEHMERISSSFIRHCSRRNCVTWYNGTTQNDENNYSVIDDGTMISFISINSTTASPKTTDLLPPAAALQRTVSMHSAEIRCYNSGSGCMDWHTLNESMSCLTSGTASGYASEIRQQ